MITEIKVDGVGIMRHLNDWQIARLRKVKREDQHDTQIAFSLGMTLPQYRRNLSAEEKAECRQAWGKLMSDEGVGLPPIRRKAGPPAKGSHVPIDRQIFIGRQLLEIRAKLARGEFPRWLHESGGISMSQAKRFMKAAQEADSRPVEREAA